MIGYLEFQVFGPPLSGTFGTFLTENSWTWWAILVPGSLHVPTHWLIKINNIAWWTQLDPPKLPTSGCKGSWSPRPRRSIKWPSCQRKRSRKPNNFKTDHNLVDFLKLFDGNIQAMQCHPEERANRKSSGKAACASRDLTSCWLGRLEKANLSGHGRSILWHTLRT